MIGASCASGLTSQDPHALPFKLMGVVTGVFASPGQQPPMVPPGLMAQAALVGAFAAAFQQEGITCTELRAEACNPVAMPASPGRSYRMANIQFTIDRSELLALQLAYNKPAASNRLLFTHVLPAAGQVATHGRAVLARASPPATIGESSFVAGISLRVTNSSWLTRRATRPASPR